MVLFLYVYACRLFFFFNDTATTEIYTLSLHDALPISSSVKKPMTDLENTIRKTPKTDIKEAANFMAVQPDFSAPVGFPAPRFCPTRVVAAVEKAIPGIKEMASVASPMV